MTNVGYNCHIGLDTLCDHFSTTQSNFFLYGICNVKTKRKFYLILMQQTCNFRNHKSTDAVVEGTAHKLIFIEDMKSIWIGNHTSNVYAHFFDFFFVFRSDINRDIFELGCILFTSHTGMDSGPTKNTFNDTFFRVNIYPFRGGNHMVWATIPDYVYESIFSNIVYIPWNFIWMRFDNNFKWCIWVDHTNSSSIRIRNKGINIWF